jgi:hypothetical protein
MRSCGFAHASLAAPEEDEFGSAHNSLFSNASSMICWADTTLPSSRVRSDALRTNLFKRALVGRSVMGTVSGSLGFAFFGFGRAGTNSAAGSLVAGAGDTNTGAGAELVPAGCLAAAAIRAAKSLESRFFFM